MTTDEFEKFDALQAELWVARRFRQFVSDGFPPDLSLIFATHAEVAVPRESSDTGFCVIFPKRAAA